MEVPAPARAVKIWRWLPYWAVFQADLRHTLTSWVYVFWVAGTMLASLGYLLFRFGVAHEAGIIQPASLLMSDLLRWTLLGSLTLIIVLTGSSISSERGTMADSVLSRGISRYQYFLGKWHARLVTVVGTFLLMGLVALAGSYFLLHEDLSWRGSFMAMATVASLLAMVISCGVTVSAMTNNTLLGIAVLWMTTYGTGYGLSLLPGRFLSPDRLLASLPYILQGYYDLHVLSRLIGCAVGGSCLVALIGIVHFGRRDV